MNIQADQIHCFDPARWQYLCSHNSFHGKHSPRTASQAHSLNAGDSAQAFALESDDQIATRLSAKLMRWANKDGRTRIGKQGLAFIYVAEPGDPPPRAMGLPRLSRRP